MSHYMSDGESFLLGLGLKRSARTLCGRTLDDVEDLGDGPCTCGDCRRINGDDRGGSGKRLFGLF